MMDIENRKKELAELIGKRSGIKDPLSVAFDKTGKSAANIISEELTSYLGNIGGSHRILDFGAGSGRVAIPLLKKHPTMQLYCDEVDAESIEYLALCLPEHCSAKQGNYMPPTSYPDDFFDAVYSISVWSHFPEDLGLQWLKEMHRITKDGAFLFISIAGFNVLEAWKKAEKLWGNVTADDFVIDKFIYKEFAHLDTNEKHYPGISKQGSWGNTAIHPDYVHHEWAKLFSVKEIKEGRMNGMQDLVVLKK